MDKGLRKQLLQLMRLVDKTEKEYKEIIEKTESKETDFATRCLLAPKALELKRELDFLKESLSSWM